LPVLNASPLIYLSKIQKLELLNLLFEDVQIPIEVKKEVVDKGKALGYTDAYMVEKALSTQKIRLHTLGENDIESSRKLAEKYNIDEGEAQVIKLALKKGDKIVIMDDARARKIARLFGLEPIGILKIILKAVEMRYLTDSEAIDLLDKLIDKGFHISIGLYKEFLKRIRKN